MDYGTDTIIPRLNPGQKVELPLKAVLNNRILGVTEDTPIQAEFTLTYFDNGKEEVISRALPLRVYSRNAIIWDRPERIATFITLNDTPVKDFQRQVMAQAGAGPSGTKNLNRALRSAIVLWNAIGEAGLKYEPSPNSPFETISQDPTFPVDYTQFPRETLKHRGGQCDDLATLFSSLLEAAAVKTALLDYPGHMAIMFDTGVNDPALVGLPESEMILYQDTYWIPFEPTVVGASFLDSHRKAIAAYKEMKKKGKVSIIDPRTAWATFEPATMPPTDWTPDVPKAADVSRRSDLDLAQYARQRYTFLRDMFKEMLAQNGSNAEAIVGLGILEMENGNMDKAEGEFAKALAVDPGDSAAMNNLGSISFLAGHYEKARTWFSKATDKDSQDPGIWLNLAKASAKLKDPAKVKLYGNKAVELDPNMEPAVQALLR
jgi:tetratricopeptide (TPR) repeat protein